MRKLLFGFAVLSLVSCAKKKWDKATVKADCMKEMNKDKDARSMFSEEQGDKICDCSAEKTVAAYKTESEAKKDQSGLENIGKNCAMEVLGMGKPAEGTQITEPATNETPGENKEAADSSGHE